jgi:hypothetical protein
MKPLPSAVITVPGGPFTGVSVTLACVCCDADAAVTVKYASADPLFLMFAETRSFPAEVEAGIVK